MKTKTCLRFGLCFVVAATLSAQPLFTDSLTPPTVNWANSPANRGDGTLIFFNNLSTSGLGYAVSSPTSDDAGFRTLSTFAAPTTSAWMAQVDVRLPALGGLTPSQYANLNLIVVKASDGFNFNATLAIDRYNNGSVVVQDIDSYVTTAGVESHLPEVLDSTTFATLAISYDPLSSQLIYAYDADGPDNGAAFNVIHAADISGWAMGPSDTFGFLLVGGSGAVMGGPGAVLVMTDAYFQNFSVNGLAVPEPSTYALLLLGVGLLAAVGLRRRVMR